MKALFILWLVAFAWAFVPHAPNFSPVVAACLLVGLWQSRAPNRTGVVVAMAGLLLGQDLILALLSQSPAGGGLSFSAEASLMRLVCLVRCVIN